MKKEIVTIFVIIILFSSIGFCSKPFLHGIFCSTDKMLFLKLDSNGTFIIKFKFENTQICQGQWHYISKRKIVLKCSEDDIDIRITSTYWGKRKMKIEIVNENTMNIYLYVGSTVLYRTNILPEWWTNTPYG